MSKEKIKVFLILQVGIFIFSIAGVLTKVLAESIIRSKGISLENFIYCIEIIIIYALYALIWQYVLKHLSLTVAYMTKSSVLIWSLLWAYIFFDQHITLDNILSVLLIITGIVIIQKE